MVLCDMHASPESGPLWHWSSSLGQPWKMVVKGNPPTGQNWEQCTYLFCLQREMARRKGLPRVMVWLGRWTGRSTTGKSKGLKERGLRIELSDWQSVKIFGFHVNAHWRAGEGFNNRVDGMTHLVDIRQPPSPATPVDLWTGWPWWQWWRLCMASATWTCVHQDWPGYSCCSVPSLPAGDSAEPLMWHHCRKESASYLVLGWLHWTTFILEEAASCSYWNWHLL